MKQVMLSVLESKAFMTDLARALAPAALDSAITAEGLSDRDVRNLAEILREIVLLAEESRIVANRKTKVDSNGK